MTLRDLAVLIMERLHPGTDENLLDLIERALLVVTELEAECWDQKASDATVQMPIEVIMQKALERLGDKR